MKTTEGFHFLKNHPYIREIKMSDSHIKYSFKSKSPDEGCDAAIYYPIYDSYHSLVWIYFSFKKSEFADSLEETPFWFSEIVTKLKQTLHKRNEINDFFIKK